MRETWVQSLGWEDPLEKGKAPHSSIVAWIVTWTVESMGRKESGTTERLPRHITSLSCSSLLPGMGLTSPGHWDAHGKCLALGGPRAVRVTALHALLPAEEVEAPEVEPRLVYCYPVRLAVPAPPVPSVEMHVENSVVCVRYKGEMVKVSRNYFSKLVRATVGGGPRREHGPALGWSLLRGGGRAAVEAHCFLPHSGSFTATAASTTPPSRGSCPGSGVCSAGTRYWPGRLGAG